MSKVLSIEERLQRHHDYWNGVHQKRPLTCFRVGSHFFSREFAANDNIIEKGHVVTADQVIVDDYLPDYERMYQDLETLGQDCFFATEPCTGFPWMEAIFGADVIGSTVSFVSHPIYSDPEELLENIKKVKLGATNPWYQKYLEFSEKLTKLANGRFPVAQPILRGVTDTAGSLISQMELAYGIIDEPEIFKQVFDIIVEGQRALIADQYKVTEPFHGGRSFGFYHLWAPGSVMWYQEDLASLMSKNHYEQYLRKTSERYIEGYDYSLVHLHPTSFIHLDGILSLKNLSVVEITKDEGLNMTDILPECKKVLESGKKLSIGMGYFTKEDIDVIYEEMPHHSTHINIITHKLDEAKELLDYIDSKNW